MFGTRAANERLSYNILSRKFWQPLSEQQMTHPYETLWSDSRSDTNHPQQAGMNLDNHDPKMSQAKQGKPRQRKAIETTRAKQSQTGQSKAKRNAKAKQSEAKHNKSKQSKSRAKQEQSKPHKYYVIFSSLSFLSLRAGQRREQGARPFLPETENTYI